MIKLKKILPLSLMALLVMSACSNPLSKKEVTPSAVIGSPNEIVTESNVVEEGGADGTVSEAVPMSRFGTGLKCSQLKSELGRQECEMQINDMIGNMLEREILSSYDAGRCKELPVQAAESCQTRLSETGVKGPVSDEEIALFQEITRGTFPEVEEGEESPRYPTYNKARCAELKASGYKAYCEKQVAERMERNLFDEIIQSEQSSRCGEFSDEQMKKECKMFFGLEDESTDVENADVESVDATEEVKLETRVVPAGNKV